MTKEEWRQFIPYFTPEECGEKMETAFMLKTLMLRKALDSPMYITSGYCTTGHSKNSLHYEGRALDWFCKLSPRKVVRQIDRLGLFNGLGVYWWGYHKPFYHIDDRHERKYQRWVSPNRGSYIYLLQS